MGGIITPLIDVGTGRGIDWGESEQHWFSCTFGCRDLEHNWLIYDCYSSNDQRKITSDHAIEVLSRSLAWGWPIPEPIKAPENGTRYVAGEVLKRLKEVSPETFHAIER